MYGTGLYEGFAEPKRTAVVCLNCNGTGCIDLKYIPFVKRHERRDVNIVKLSRGSFIGTGVGPAVNSISYKEFQEGKMPTT